MDFDTLNSPAATAQNWDAVDDIILNGEKGAASASASHGTEISRKEPTYEELMQELRRLIPDNSPELQNVRAARFASMSYGEGNREASIEAARKANRNLANSGVDNISATGNMWEYWDNRARAVMNNPDATAEQLQLRRKQIEAFARYCQTSPDSPYRNWPEEAKRTFMQWASQTMRHLDDMAEIRRDQPDDTGLWNEAWRAYRRFGIQNDLAIAGLGRLVTGGKWEAANEMYRDYSRLLEMPEVIPSREATRAWYTPNALTATFTEGTLSMMESVATAYVGGQIGAAASGLGKGAKAAAEAGALASRIQKGAYFGHTIGWTVPFGIEAAGNKFNEAWEYNRVHHPEWTERESYWNAAGQAATAAAIEIGSEYCGAMWGVGRLQAERLYGRLANRALKGQAERLVLRTAQESGRQWLGRLAKAGAGAFAEEWGEEVAADVANQFVADPLWKGDSELFREYRRNGLDGMWAAFSVMMVQNAIAVSTTCLSGAYHAATGYRLTGAADWYSTPVQAAAHYGIVDARPASLTAAGIQSLLEGNRQRAQQAAKELDGLDEGQYGRQGRIGAQLIGELMGYSAGVRELLDAARDTAMFRDKKGTVTVDVFQPASDRGDCFVTISEGDEIRGIALAQDGEEAAFLQELVLSEVTGKVSQYLVDLSQLPQAGQMSATYAYRREDGTWVARTRAGSVAIDSAKNTSFLPAGVRDAIESALDDRKVEPLPKPMQCMGLLRPANASPAEKPGKDNAGEGAATLRDRPEQVSAAEAVENRNNALSALVKEAQERYRELTLDQAKKRLRELDAQISGLQATEEEAAERSALVSIIDELEDPSTLEDVEDSIRQADKGATAVVDGTADEETLRRWSVPTWLRELSEGDGSLDGQAFERLPVAMEQHLAAAMQDTRFAEAVATELSAFRKAVEDKDKKGTVEHGNRLLDAFIAWEDELKRSNARNDGTVSQATSDVRDSALKAMLEQASSLDIDGSAYHADNTRLPDGAVLAVVDLASPDVLWSDRGDRRYPMDLAQNRQMTSERELTIQRMASDFNPERVLSTSGTYEGVPTAAVLDGSLVVLIGNTRTAAADTAYGKGTAGDLKARTMEWAGEHGFKFDGEAPARPMLMRILPAGLTHAQMSEIVQKGNQSPQQAQTAAKDVDNDARVLAEHLEELLPLLRPTDSADFISGANVSFAQRFVELAGHRTGDSNARGEMTSALNRRIQNALLGYLFQGMPRERREWLMENVVADGELGDLGIKNAIGGLVDRIGALLRLEQDNRQYSLVGELQSAVDNLATFRQRLANHGVTSASDYLQGDPLLDAMDAQIDRPAEMSRAAQAIFLRLANAKSRKAVRDFFDAYLDEVSKQVRPEEDLFGTGPQNKFQLLARLTGEDVTEQPKDKEPVAKKEEEKAGEKTGEQTAVPAGNETVQTPVESTTEQPKTEDAEEKETKARTTEEKSQEKAAVPAGNETVQTPEEATTEQPKKEGAKEKGAKASTDEGKSEEQTSVSAENADETAQAAAEPPAVKAVEFEPTDERLEELANVFAEPGLTPQIRAARLSRLAREWGTDQKSVEEWSEYCIARMVHDLQQQDIPLEEKWRRVLAIYQGQPALATRTSTSVVNQAYSTPAPLAWILGNRIGLNNSGAGIVYEPTAGTGMLVAATSGASLYLNEIDPRRREILRRSDADFLRTPGVFSQAQVTGEDARTFVPNAKGSMPKQLIADFVVANPPFDTAPPLEADGFRLTKLDHQIAANALNVLRPEGRAFLIVGANLMKTGLNKGQATLADKVFMNFLYSHFNVQDNLILSGDLYRKQGASFPLRVFTINGRKKYSGEMTTAPLHPDMLHSWEEVHDRLIEPWNPYARDNAQGQHLHQAWDEFDYELQEQSDASSVDDNGVLEEATETQQEQSVEEEVPTKTEGQEQTVQEQTVSFRRATGNEAGVDGEELRNAVTTMGFVCPIVVTEGDEGLPDTLRQRMIQERTSGRQWTGWKGVYDEETSTVYINAAAHDTMEDARETLLHEAAVHHGLRAFFRSEQALHGFLDMASERLFYIRQAAMNKEAAGLEHYAAIEEAVADVAEDSRAKSVWERIAAWLKDAFARLFRLVSGIELPSDTWLRQVLKDAAQAAREHRFTPFTSGMLFNLKEDLAQAQSRRIDLGLNDDFSLERREQIRHGAAQTFAAMRELADGSQSVTLERPEIGEIQYDLGRIGSRGYGLLHIVEQRMKKNGYSLEEAAEVAVRTGLSAVLGVEENAYFNKHLYAHGGVRAVVAFDNEFSRPVITGFVVGTDATNKKGEDGQQMPHMRSDGLQDSFPRIGSEETGASQNENNTRVTVTDADFIQKLSKALKKAIGKLETEYNVMLSDGMSNTIDPTEIDRYGKFAEMLLQEGFNGTLLDAGTGLGAVVLKEHGFDIDKTKAWDKGYNRDFHLGETLKDNYDVVLADRFLVGVPLSDRNDVLADLSSRVAPGGRLLVSGNDAPHLRNYITRRLGQGWTVSEAPAASGFQVIATRAGQRNITAATHGKIFFRDGDSHARHRRLAILDRLLSTPMAEWLKRNFSWGERRGNVQPVVNQLLQRMKGRIASDMEGLRVLVKRINDNFTAIGDKKIADELRHDLNGFLAGRDLSQNTLHLTTKDANARELVDAFREGRRLIDDLSLRMLHEMGDLLPHGLTLTISNNLGHYTLRAYEKFQNPNYRPTKEVVKRAQRAVKAELMDNVLRVIDAAHNLKLPATHRDYALAYVAGETDETEMADLPERTARRLMHLREQLHRAIELTNDAVQVTVENSIDDAGHEVRILDYAADNERLNATAQGVVDYLLSKDVESPDSGLYQGKSAARNKILRSSFLERQDLPDWLRELYGEITDCALVLQNTVSRGIRVLAANDMLKALRQASEELDVDNPQRIFYQNAYRNEGHDATVKLEGFGYGALNGWFTDRNTAAMLADYSGQGREVMLLWKKFISMSRAAKTAYNVPTHFRNVLGNLVFAANDGMIFRPSWYRNWARAFAMLLSDSPDAVRERRHLMELGLIGSGAHAEEFSQTVRDAFGTPDVLNFPGRKILSTFVGGVSRAMEFAYALEDNVFRVASFYTRTADDGLTEDAAVANVRRLYPTYDQAPAVIDQWRRYNPLAPDFMAFRFESLRCMANSVADAWKAIKNGEMKEATLRVSGVLASLSLALGVFGTTVGGFLGGFGKDDDEKDAARMDGEELDSLRLLLPSYRQDNTVLAWRDGAHIRYVDLGYIYPYEQWPLAWNILTARGRTADDRLTDMFKRVCGNYLIGNMAGDSIMDLMRNRTTFGQQVWDNFDPIWIKAAKGFGHLGQALVPSMFTFGARSLKLALSEEDSIVDAHGNITSAGTEALRMALPYRVYQFDPAVAYTRRMRSLAAQVREEKAKANVAWRRWHDGYITRDAAESEIERTRSIFADSGLLKQLHFADNAGRILGLDFDRRFQLLKEAGFSIDEAERILTARPLAYTLPEQ